MKGITQTAVAAGLLLVSVAASAEVSFNAAVTSDYRFRGISQSAKDPAIQGGVDWSDKSGLYLGVWGSTIDFGAGDPDADLEVDLYGGYKWMAAGLEWDAGFIHYAYPGSTSSNDWDFTEVYLGTTFGPVGVKAFYTNNFTGPTDDGALYITASSSIELGQGYTLGLALGHSSGDGVDASIGDSFMDWKVSVSKDFAGFGFNLAYIGSNLDPEVTSDVGNSEGNLVLTITKTF
jgi:uncharacterized protein (TIGR02001 family)